MSVIGEISEAIAAGRYREAQALVEKNRLELAVAEAREGLVLALQLARASRAHIREQLRRLPPRTRYLPPAPVRTWLLEG